MNLTVASATFGAVESGKLEVRGRLQTAEWKQERHSGLHTYCDRLRLPSSSAPGDFLALRAFSDAKEADGFGADWSTVSLLLVLGPRPIKSDSSTLEPTPVYSGLLPKDKGNNVHTRLGVIFFVTNYNYYERIHPESEEKWRARFLFSDYLV